ncbi:penicillin-binding protein 2 [Vibrio kanaloae]|uniref:Peptidoglycan D,D-transpeptidase MrdA n=1 Tax=Vibrio kanaloae TaxID=170673 RepID=A0A4U1Z0S1_9VIBR|nr:penicillin-binding protein 2 [Vibrio kanaloae]TKF25961.1 penicillin-binding protein 2 [Vibrio kanaloae]
MNNKRIKLRDHKREIGIFRTRIVVVYTGIIFLTLILIGNLYRLQVVNFERYQALADGNRIKLLPIAPTRGLIYDRNGYLLADNKITYTLTMIPEQTVDVELMLQRLSKFIVLDTKKINNFKHRLNNKRSFESVTILENMNETEVAKFSVRKYQFPGLSLEARKKRFYPHGEVLTHVLGYVGRINNNELIKLDKKGVVANYQATKVIGKLGVELYYEHLLHGKKGYREVEVTSQGRIVRTIKYIPALSGKDIVLNIDLELQNYLFHQLAPHTGSAILLDSKDNSVLAMASAPSYDPNLFVDGISNKNYQKLLDDPARPLINRATLGVYPPASTIKPFMAIAGLQERVISNNTIRDNHGEWKIPGSAPNSKAWRDWNRWGHGPVNVTEAIEESVNSFFYQTAFDLGIDRISSWMKRFGFGEPTGIDLYEESTANLPTREWKLDRYSIPWYQGDTIPVGIGQGYWTSTPLQLAKATSILVNRGRVTAPHLLKATLNHGESFNTQQIIAHAPIRVMKEVSNKVWNIPLNAMRLVNHGSRGSARNAFKDVEYTSGGKSGTAQVFNLAKGQIYNSKKLARSLHDQALYTTFAPYEYPQYIATVVIENGNGGSKVGAPYIRKLLDFAFDNQKNDVQ